MELRIDNNLYNIPGFEGLYKDDDGFVYNENKDGSMIIVTNNNKRQVIAVSDNWKASNMCQKSDK